MSDLLSTDSPTSTVDTYPRKPTGPRWAGRKPPISDARAAAIAKKRAWQRACDERSHVPLRHFVAESELDAMIYTRALVRRFRPELELLDGVAERLRDAHWRLLTAFVVAFLEYAKLGLIATHAQLGKLAQRSPRQTRRIVAELRELGLVVVVTATYELHAGGASSERGLAYALAPTVLGGIARGRVSLAMVFSTENGQPSGTVLTLAPDQGSGPERDQRSLLMGGHAGAAEPATPGVVSAAPTRSGPDLAAVPDASADGSWPGRREDATRDAALRAPEGVGGGEEPPDEIRALLREFVARGGAS